MADGYLESHYAEYEKRKALWLKNKNKWSNRKKTTNNQLPNGPINDQMVNGQMVNVQMTK